MNTSNIDAEDLRKASFEKMQEERDKAWKKILYIPNKFYDGCYWHRQVMLEKYDVLG